jgi:hypothetical protein
MVDRVAMQVCGTLAARRAESVRKHADDLIVFFARQRGIGVGAGDQLKQRLFGIVACRYLRYDLLRQHVERLGGNAEAIQFAAANTASSSALHSTNSSRESGNRRAFGTPPTL